MRRPSLVPLLGRLAVLAAATPALPAYAHEGHGLALPHLHSHEWMGLALAAAVGAALWWWVRRGGGR
ncbi:hypothetical protein [Ideonella sp.]|uniref:hypothetical protein n=1 Tax=Ideonella sp. TaxID=1929293 RepID=UPI0035B343B6